MTLLSQVAGRFETSTFGLQPRGGGLTQTQTAQGGYL
jgi:hypothetical protein